MKHRFLFFIFLTLLINSFSIKGMMSKNPLEDLDTTLGQLWERLWSLSGALGNPMPAQPLPPINITPAKPVQKQTMINSWANADKETKINRWQEMSSTVNDSIPAKEKNILRIMSWNVHFWTKIDKVQNVDEIIKVILTVDPDILILQEVSQSSRYPDGEKKLVKTDEFEGIKKINNLYKHAMYCDTLFGGGFFGNVILSKSIKMDSNKSMPAHFREQKSNSKEKRCWVRVVISIPVNGSDQLLTIYGTHLEDKPYDDTATRFAQMKEIVDDIKVLQEDPRYSNVLIAADTNDLRKNNTKSQQTPAGYAFDNGFTDCFTKLGWEHPNFTNWYGTEIDFILLGPKWNLPLAGCYVDYTNASDHLPIIMDIAL